MTTPEPSPPPEDVPPEGPPPLPGAGAEPPLRRYAVCVSYDTSLVNEVTVEAASPEEACARAIGVASDDASGWGSTDWVGPGYVGALAEGGDARDGGRAVRVPERFTAFGTLYPSALVLTHAVGRLLRYVAEGRVTCAPSDAEAAALWGELAERYVAVVGVAAAAEEGLVPPPRAPRADETPSRSAPPGGGAGGGTP